MPARAISFGLLRCCPSLFFVRVVFSSSQHNLFFHLVDTTLWWQWQTPASDQSHAKHWWREFSLTYSPLVVPPLLRSTAISSIANFTFVSLDISVAHWNANTGRTRWRKPVLPRLWAVSRPNYCFSPILWIRLHSFCIPPAPRPTSHPTTNLT